jgi:hypothetical protein
MSNFGKLESNLISIRATIASCPYLVSLFYRSSVIVALDTIVTMKHATMR